MIGHWKERKRAPNGNDKTRGPYRWSVSARAQETFHTALAKIRHQVFHASRNLIPMQNKSRVWRLVGESGHPHGAAAFKPELLVRRPGTGARRTQWATVRWGG